MSEREDAKLLAFVVLDEPWADPDDDVRTLARQFLRAEERIAELEAENESLRHSLYDCTEQGANIVVIVARALGTSKETPPYLRGPIIQAHADTNGVPPVETACEHDYSGRCNNIDGSEQIFCAKCGRNP